MIAARFSEYAHELASLARCYPPFVLRGGQSALQPGELPVFVFHTIEPERFDRQLSFLAENGYRTVGLEEYLGLLTGRLQGTGKEVLLTIDDARSSVWRYGFPLLLKHRAKAAVFVITGWTSDSGTRPRLGTADEQSVREADPDDVTVCTWEELREMRASGLVDVESHSHLHRRVFVDRRLIGLVTERSVATASDAAFSPYLSPEVSPLSLPKDRFVGYPLFPVEPLLGAPRMLELSEEVAAAVSDRYRQSPRPISPASMKEIAANVPASAFRAVSREEVVQEIRADLGKSQETLRAGLGDPDVGKHLCLPFTVGSDVTVELARSLGFSSIFWGVDASKRSNLPGTDPMRVVRLKNDFLWRLPGKGRRSLPAIYVEKAMRRLTGVSPY